MATSTLLVDIDYPSISGLELWCLEDSATMTDYFQKRELNDNDVLVGTFFGWNEYLLISSHSGETAEVLVADMDVDRLSWIKVGSSLAAFMQRWSKNPEDDWWHAEDL